MEFVSKCIKEETKMNWYAIQVTTGKEAKVIAALKDFGAEVLQPIAPIYLKHGGNIRLQYRPLMPGYVIAKLDETAFYKYKRDLRLEKMMIRLCGNGYDAVSLSTEELQFFQLCSHGMQPLILKQLSDSCFEILNPPPWAGITYLNWYDGDKFKAKLQIRTNGNLKDHAFTVAAFSSRYEGRYRDQLQDLLGDGFG